MTDNSNLTLTIPLLNYFRLAAGEISTNAPHVSMNDEGPAIYCSIAGPSGMPIRRASQSRIMIFALYWASLAVTVSLYRSG